MYIENSSVVFIPFFNNKITDANMAAYNKSVFAQLLASKNKEAALGALYPNMLPVYNEHRKPSVSEK